MAVLEPNRDDNNNDIQQSLNLQLEIQRLNEIISQQKSQLAMEKSFALQAVVNTLNRLVMAVPVQENGKSSGYVRLSEVQLALYKKRVEQIVTQLYVEKELLKQFQKGL